MHFDRRLFVAKVYLDQKKTTWTEAPTTALADKMKVTIIPKK